MTITSRRLLPALAAVAMLGISGCATITRGSTQAFLVGTTPGGATVSLSNGERCESPCAITLKRKHPFAVEVCKSGYRTITTQVIPEVSGAGGTAMAGNVLIGGLIGVGIDAGTGAMKDLRPNPLVVRLEAEEPGCIEPAFPAVPEKGQTPDAYVQVKQKKSKRSR